MTPTGLLCCTPGCRLPWASVQGDALVLLSRHNGEKHCNRLTIEEIERLLLVLRSARTTPVPV